MTNPEHPSHGPPHSEETAVTVTRRYTPPGNRELIEKLKRLRQLTKFKAATQAPSMPDDMREILLRAGLNDVSEDRTTAYQKAVELDRNYGEAIRAEEELADEFLRQFAEPYMIEPSRAHWGTVRGVSEDQAVFLADMRIPFTQSEIEGIHNAREARQRIMRSEMIEGGIAKDFWNDSQLFPTDIRSGPLVHALSNRPHAVWGIMTAARAAENALLGSVGRPNLFSENDVRLFITVRDLPDKLIRHKPPPNQ